MDGSTLIDLLRCPAPASGADDARCRGRLRDDSAGLRCGTCGSHYGLMPGGPRLTAGRTTSEYLDPELLAAYHEMHFAAFATVPEGMRGDLPDAASGPAYHVAQLHAARALTEGFYQSLCELLDAAAPLRRGAVVADIACATGRMSAEVAARGAKVLAVDLSEAFVNEARRILLGSGGRPRLTFSRDRGGFRDVTAELPWALDPQSIMFAVADATSMPLADEAADLVLVLNLIDRVPEPGAILREAWRCVAPGGHLLHADPFDYRESSTPDATKRIYDVAGFLGDLGGKTVHERPVAFPVRRAWTQNVMAYVAEVGLYRKAANEP